MREQPETTIPPCPWRFPESKCSRDLIARIAGPTGIRLPGAGKARRKKRMTVLDVVHQIEGTCPGEKGLPCLAAKGRCCARSPTKPRYELHGLYVGDVRVHRFAYQARAEIAAVMKFQAEDWPQIFARPRGQSLKWELKYGQSLKSTAFELNECQWLWLIHFHSHPSDCTMAWEWVCS